MLHFDVPTLFIYLLYVKQLEPPKQWNSIWDAIHLGTASAEELVYPLTTLEDTRGSSNYSANLASSWVRAQLLLNLCNHCSEVQKNDLN